MTFDIKKFLSNLPNSPGIYQMFNAQGEILYIGKARHLKKRVTSYFRGKQVPRIASLVSQIDRIEFIVTHTENDALLLESNFIKKCRPRYNILLRDDKSYPYIVLTRHQDFPRLDFYRGPKLGQNIYFGPYPSTIAVRETLNLLQKLFRLRSCEDSFFRNRTRPCLQYQIKRCTAPCVGYIDAKSYQQDVQRAVLFLKGKSQEIVQELVEQMEAASIGLEFEKAARYRDQIAHLRHIQQQQVVATDHGDVDIIALAAERGSACLQVMSVRAGRLLGSKSYFPDVPSLATAEEILTAFLPQYYLQATVDREIPRQIILSHKILEAQWLINAFSEHAQHSISFTDKPRGERNRWLQLAMKNAQHALNIHLVDRATTHQQLEALQGLLGLDNLPQYLECFDVSHTQGEETVASCVVFGEEGVRKQDYRRFNIENITPGDDYAALRQALMRHYTKLKTDENKLPDVLVIDGGKGQLKQAELVLEELQIAGVIILSIAKGVARKPGLETLYLSGQKIPLDINPSSLAFHLIQKIRDEAHRFAITGHRGRRAKVHHTSILENIEGIGAKRRRELLRQFGGLQELKRASVDEIVKVPGISKSLAQRIYLALQSQ